MDLVTFLSFLISLKFISQISAQRSCATVNDQSVIRVTDLENVDFIFAGLFPIKKKGCREYQLEKGVERMEAMIRALELINADPNLLEGIKIGYDMRDTCSEETVGIEETVSLIQSEFFGGNLTGIPIGVIGASSSSVSVPVASFLRVFSIPQISYSSSTALLSDTDRYDYFFRTVAPDNFQARAMLDLITRFGWRFVNAVYTASTYGTPGVEAFIEAVEGSNGTCLDVESQVPRSETMLLQLAGRIAMSKANVVVCFCTTVDANRILNAVNNHIQTNQVNRTHIVWIASDAWATSESTISGLEGFVDGFFGVSPFSDEFKNFTEYFTSISPYNISNDLWFCGFFREKFNCNFTATDSTRCPDSIRSGGKPFTQNSKIQFIFDATYALAIALDSVLKGNCKSPYNVSGLECENLEETAMVNVGRVLLRDALYRVNFTGITGDRVFFDASGDGLAKYTIHNYVYNGMQSGGEFKVIGVWDASQPKESRLSLGNFSNPRIANITSFCGGTSPCETGFRTDYQVGSGRCCWTCEPCRGNTFNSLAYSESCKECPNGEWGDNPTNSNKRCVKIPIMFIHYNEWWCWVFLVFSIAGFVGWVTISIMYLANWNHRVVKASGRENCVLMLIGAGICFALAFFTIAKPIVFTCIVWSFTYWASLSLLIFPLLMKIIRIVRIFISKKPLHNRHFINWQWQLVFSLVPVAIVLSIVAISYVTKQEVVEEMQVAFSELESPTIQIRCQQAHPGFTVVLYSIFVLSVILLVFFAILTRTYPKNYRESVHIMYASFALIVVIFVNVVIFFVLPDEFQVYRQLVQNLCLILIAYTILLAFFSPRLWYILFGAKGITEEDKSYAATEKTDEGTMTLKRKLVKRHPSFLNPFDKYINKHNAENQENSFATKNPDAIKRCETASMELPGEESIKDNSVMVEDTVKNEQ